MPLEWHLCTFPLSLEYILLEMLPRQMSSTCKSVHRYFEEWTWINYIKKQKKNDKRTFPTAPSPTTTAFIKCLPWLSLLTFHLSIFLFFLHWAHFFKKRMFLEIGWMNTSFYHPFMLCYMSSLHFVKKKKRITLWKRKWKKKIKKKGRYQLPFWPAFSELER